MVAATQPPPPLAPTAPTTTSAEEEALKRNTDCVYFLASPLTCKKGSDCEYRHSEYARVNPRDCYFWLNGNCLNPKCGFRHPPLDGLFGTQTTASASASAGSSLPPSHAAAATAATHAHHNSGKQGVLCIFFQQGICLKGDRCAFSHGPNHASNRVSQTMALTPGTEPPPPKKVFGGLQKGTQERKLPQVNLSKAVEAPTVVKPVSKAEIASARNSAGFARNVGPPKSMDDEVPRYKPSNLPPEVNGNSSRSNRLHLSRVADDHVIQNGKEADEYLRESSPGFDVLVDDELRGSDYFHGEDQFGRTIGHEGRNLNSVDEYDMGHSTDYGSLPDDLERYGDPRGSDPYEHMQGQHAWEQHRVLPERMLVAPAHLERRGHSKTDSPEHIEGSDLRYLLSKQRRVNGLRSVVSNDFVPGNHVEERDYRGSSRRDPHHSFSHESSVSSRLRGRIKLPGGSPNEGNDLHVEREIDRGRNRGRLSPVRSMISSQQGRFRDRMKARVEEDYIEGRNFRGPQVRRELIDDKGTNFAAPKSLAELRGGTNAEGKLQQSLGKRKCLEDHPPSDADRSFDGPMSLSEILKRKRGGGAAASGSRISSVIEYDNTQKESRQSLISNSNKAVAETQSGSSSSVLKDNDSSHLLKNKESKFATDDALGTEGENIEIVHRQSSQLPNPNEIETEDGMIADDGMEDHEYEGDDQRDGDYEYEQVDEGDYNYEEGENVDEDEYENEDGDDFAKKIGVVFS
ncbi:ZN-FINGER C-X8-C-X5-C-X3-H TYPE-CONTAINING [Salix koriyanagi]|uniref:ZN-FINGER C-X8-C-X5-C-X3-H TYPE-CONTAINING n=1 Tax=Salix koriyanagi TaxID=2511006 RepID=A0A9Q1AHL3_9ROSI|nr:ZN-FINGER C-X8-C-X5-C-X3-H TYPE-CONTAINING [Salix koriyanagi]